MSASTVSVSAHQGPVTRRRAVEKNLPTGGSDFAAAAAVIADSDARPTNAGDTAAAILRDARKTSSAQIQAKKSGAAKKATKPRWLTVVSILTKNLALVVVLLGFVQMVRWTVMNSGGDVGDSSIMSGDFEGKLSEVEKFVKKTMKAMQVQMNALDHKVEDGISSVRKEFDEKFERKEAEVDLKLKALDVRSDAFEKFMDGFESKSLLSKEDFSEFFEEFKRTRKGGKTEVNVDDIIKYAREVVLNEIEKHAADGLGMVDYALVSGGARVVKHSEPYGGKAGGSANWLLLRSRVSAEAERMIKPSFGEPGQCFALKGGSGFVEIRLRTAIVPEAVTLEHVAKSVAYDRSSAPKHCRVSGWLQTDPEIVTEKMFLLTEFTYDLQKSNAQTYKVESSASNLVDIIRLDFTSNHGSASHTCIYRLRVHGREPSHVPALETQS
ncbi:SUN domain-containing protein 1-like [Salvia hispanica]|uniref:SUN domain-containing protein 1-like n=1 Tax=Salvia hispanica TaxID=49212 RepID=UPI0020096612|nr:SUN domain-containing protein 1-like [Salvia hispanica]